MRSIKSLILTQDFPPVPGGVSVYVENLVRNWKGATTVLAPMHNQSLRQEFPGNVEIRRIPMDLTRGTVLSFLKRQASLYKRSLNLIKTKRIDLIQCAHLSSGLAALFIDKTLSTPYVLYTYGSEITGQLGLFEQKLTRYILSNAMLIATMSDFTKEAILRYGIDEKKVRFLVGVELDLLSRGGEVEATKEKYNINGDPIILTIARLMEHKGIDTVIRALPMIIETYPNILYLVIGEGPFRSTLEKLCIDLNVDRHVRFVGNIPHYKLQQKTEAFYSICDLFVMISRNIGNVEAEGFGIVFLEAGLFRRAVVGGRSGGIASAIIDGITGKLVEPHDISGTSRCILDLLRDRKRLREMGQNGHDRAITIFDWKTNVKKWEDEITSSIYTKNNNISKIN